MSGEEERGRSGQLIDHSKYFDFVIKPRSHRKILVRGGFIWLLTKFSSIGNWLCKIPLHWVDLDLLIKLRHMHIQ